MPQEAGVAGWRRIPRHKTPTEDPQGDPYQLRGTYVADEEDREA